jgi:2,3-bisphosphoglycerate-independent phosphoglycerate mutase
MKLLYIILDGAADLPIAQLGNKTPLEAAYKPYLDGLSVKAKLGLMNVISKQIAPESDQATLALLGVNPFTHYTGRGPLEAYGSGIKIGRNSIIFRCNFAFQQNNIIKSVKIVPSENEIKAIEKALSKIKSIDNVKIKFIPTIGHRAILILSGKNLSPNVSGTHPGYKIFKNFVTTAVQKRENVSVSDCKALAKDSEKTAFVVNSWLKSAKAILESGKFSTNFILVRGAGNKLPKLPKLTKWAMLADMPVEKAIGKLCGMSVLKKPIDLSKLVTCIKRALKKYEAIYVQIKGTDEFSHNGDFKGKVKFIEELDFKFVKEISQFDKNVVICVTSDHTTSSATKTHTNDPVPVLLYVPNEIGDCLRFSEKFAVKGSLGKLTGNNLFRILRNLLRFN